MPDPTVPELLERIEILEAATWRWKLLALVVVALLGLALLGSAGMSVVFSEHLRKHQEEVYRARSDAEQAHERWRRDRELDVENSLADPPGIVLPPNEPRKPQ